MSFESRNRTLEWFLEMCGIMGGILGGIFGGPPVISYFSGLFSGTLGGNFGGRKYILL